MKTISISKDRLAVELNDGKTAQFVAWDLKKEQHKDLKRQTEIAFSIGSTFKDIEDHLKINGYDVELEDIYTS
tara:strand:- start:314 stop:532 length:219 start_codon:yes stop_codon:yes gene_type:complete